MVEQVNGQQAQRNMGNKYKPMKANERGCVSIADFLNANRSLLEQENKRQEQILMQQQRIEGTLPARQVHFDEEEIQAYDLQRGQCQVIDDPKTPFHEEASDDDAAMSNNETGAAQAEAEMDPVTQSNLDRAQQNKMMNAQTQSNVRRKAPVVHAQVQSQAVKPSGLHMLDPSDLTQRLLAAEEQKATGAQGQVIDDAASKYYCLLLISNLTKKHHSNSVSALLRESSFPCPHEKPLQERI